MKTNIDVLQHLDDLISHLTDLHAETSGKWSEMQGNEEQPNLKRKQVRDVVVDIPLYEMVLGYRMFLTSLDQCPIVRFGMEGFDVRCRTKMPNSVQSKTERYLNMEHRGHVSMNKCFNDLFGIRAIMDTEVTHAEIRDHILGTHDVRCTDSSKMDPRSGELIYIATHVYIGKRNTDFPWELQIWFSKDAAMNYASHERTKQGYTAWDVENGDIP